MYVSIYECTYSCSKPLIFFSMHLSAKISCISETWSYNAEGKLHVLSTWLLPVALIIACRRLPVLQNNILCILHQALAVWSKKQLLTESRETECCCKKRYKPTNTTLKQPRYWVAFKFINVSEHESKKEIAMKGPNSSMIMMVCACNRFLWRWTTEAVSPESTPHKP